MCKSHIPHCLPLLAFLLTCTTGMHCAGLLDFFIFSTLPPPLPVCLGFTAVLHRSNAEKDNTECARPFYLWVFVVKEWYVGKVRKKC